MGLDVYLHHVTSRAEFEDYDARYKRYEHESDTTLWDEHTKHPGEGSANFNHVVEQHPDLYENWKAAGKALRAELGLVEGYDNPFEAQIEDPSAKHPEHYFKVGYFRSSYNDAGIDHILRQQGLPTLGEMFGASAEESYHVWPDWKAARLVVATALGQMQSARTEIEGRLAVTRFSVSSRPPAMSHPTTEAEAIKLVAEAIRAFEKEKAEHPERSEFLGGSYSSVIGRFCADEPLQVRGILWGPPRWAGFLNTVAELFVVYEAEDHMAWYEAALEVVLETVDYVLAQPDPENYLLHWSG